MRIAKTVVSQTLLMCTDYKGGRKSWTVPSTSADPTAFTTVRFADFNGDGVIDGDPELDPAFDPPSRASALASSYSGPIRLNGEGMPSGLIDEYQRPVDPWRQPLRINFAADIYGKSGVGVWSTGPDMLPETDDDICSWKGAADDR